jgi:hypothetical protein
MKLRTYAGQICGGDSGQNSKSIDGTDHAGVVWPIEREIKMLKTITINAEHKAAMVKDEMLEFPFESSIASGQILELSAVPTSVGPKFY